MPRGNPRSIVVALRLTPTEAEELAQYDRTPGRAVVMLLEVARKAEKPGKAQAAPLRVAPHRPRLSDFEVQIRGKVVYRSSVRALAHHRAMVEREAGRHDVEVVEVPA